ncbi:MAG: hypothetical protein P4L85_21320 [Paludisphaera borealis]|uniref:hypothetical protein n=1 Tax=Paludisphaera borealis TaxID=1387353 RepID=UPI002851EE59|nr:hypothetical protein [Paludisphaera borealis]MDR3621906.1 hypothetical protein [Paludisphaera borealis]
MIEPSRTSTFPMVRPLRDESPQRTLPDLMVDLVNRLTSLPGRKAVELPRGSVHSYRDQDFEYVEIALTGVDDVEADICIHGGRVFVRIVR